MIGIEESGTTREGIDAPMHQHLMIRQDHLYLIRMAYNLWTLGLNAALIDVPDCLAELEHVFSLFRFRYEWGTVYEATFSNLANAEEREACLQQIPAGACYVETLDTNTLGLGAAGVHSELTHRYVAAEPLAQAS